MMYHNFKGLAPTYWLKINFENCNMHKKVLFPSLAKHLHLININCKCLYICQKEIITAAFWICILQHLSVISSYSLGNFNPSTTLCTYSSSIQTIFNFWIIKFVLIHIVIHIHIHTCCCTLIPSTSFFFFGVKISFSGTQVLCYSIVSERSTF